ncbi:esterase-like activity of phytase family protein [Qipengyuania sp. S6317L1]|uniref:esterase-like activity of phytase family protein n=1 Tax=Qipengyuania sp. S6317L1 TaxID=2926410 RepID=UPI001FF3234B|nr:esterase-like activity of phytase family protein [Qipengyuania sp. S6317L1]MCK0098998.1 esterase-like activity of phytase family protein [Qipengyuania sp. S6317L1]
MAKAFRVTAALALALMVAPGTWLRTPVVKEAPHSIALTQVAGAGDTGADGWRVEGVWHYSTEPSLRFGGFSGLLAVGGGRLRAFSDRGFLFTFIEPDRAEESPEMRLIAGLPFNDPALYPRLWDIESVTRDAGPRGDYWVGFENTHAIHRFSFRTEPEEYRIFDTLVEDWYANAGLEAMVRLTDGRFVILPEGRDEALLFDGDPVEGGEPLILAYENPAAGFAVTDLAQMPDGRVLMLMRDLDWSSYPPFAGKLAIMDAPEAGSKEPLRPRVLFDFEGVLPPENYEGIAVRAHEDGGVTVWIISDDNIAAMQRTLVAKLTYTP